MKRGDAVDLAERLLPAWRTERDKIDRIDDYMRGKHDRPYRPRDSTAEYKRLEERSVSNQLPLVLKAIAQTLFVEGYRRSGASANAPSWEVWQANGLDSRQRQVHRASLTFGVAYTTVLPGAPFPVIKGLSPRKMFAVYDDPAWDDWPRYALEVDTSEVGGERKLMLRLYDDTEVHFLSADTASTGGAEWIESRVHDFGVCPVVRFPCDLDLEGRYTGEIAPLIPVQNRINQITFDTNLVQSFGSIVIRTIAGMALPEDTNEARQRKLEMAADRFLVSEEPDTKFGSIPGTPLDGYTKVRDQAVHDLAAQSQTPPQYLLGHMANLNAEALASTESGLMRKGSDHKHVFGEAWEQTLRLSDLARGDVAGWQDYSAQTIWRDTEARSLSQTVDALGKAAQMLGLPPEMLWSRIPGFTDQDVEEAKRLRREGDPLGQLAGELRRQARPPADPGATGDDGG